MAKEVDWLKRQAANLGAYIDWPANESPEAVLRDHLSLHGNVVKVSGEDVVEMIQVAPPAHAKATDALMITAGQHLMLSLYRNHMLHVFVRPAIIAVSVNSSSQERLSVGMYRYNSQAFYTLHATICYPGASRTESCFA